MPRCKVTIKHVANSSRFNPYLVSSFCAMIAIITTNYATNDETERKLEYTRLIL